MTRCDWDDDVFALQRCTDNFTSTDPRDKIFALIGLLPSEARYMKPDYRSDYRDVLIQLTIDDIVINKSLRYLSCAPPQTASETSHLPS